MQVDCLRISLWTISAEKVGHGGAWWCKWHRNCRNFFVGIPLFIVKSSALEEHKSWFRVAGYHSINGPLVDAIKEAMDDTTPRISLLKKLTEVWSNWRHLPHWGLRMPKIFNRRWKKTLSYFSGRSVVAMTGKPARERRIISQISRSQMISLLHTEVCFEGKRIFQTGPAHFLVEFWSCTS